MRHSILLNSPFLFASRRPSLKAEKEEEDCSSAFISLLSARNSLRSLEVIADAMTSFEMSITRTSFFFAARADKSAFHHTPGRLFAPE